MQGRDPLGPGSRVSNEVAGDEPHDGRDDYTMVASLPHGNVAEAECEVIITTRQDRPACTTRARHGLRGLFCPRRADRLMDQREHEDVDRQEGGHQNMLRAM